MGPSYFVTYGGDRLTFGGTPGSIAWEQKPTMVLLNNNLDYLKMRFVTPDAEEIIIEDGNGVSSASAYVQSGSTAYWTGHGYEDNPDAKYFVSGLNLAGFDGVSADTSVSTSLYENPVHSACGSAVLTANDSASARVRTWTSRKATFGEGGTAFQVAFSASSFLGDYVSPLGSALRTAWIPHGGFVRFSASSVSGRTYSLNPLASALDAFGITWDHRGSGSEMDVTGAMNTSVAFRLGSGRNKNVYATGYNHTLWAAAGTASAASWQPLPIITAFSSNLCAGSAAATYLVGSANAGKVYGFESSTTMGAMKNSAGSWSNPTSGNTYKWGNRYFIANSAYCSATFSAMRTKGPTGSNQATYVFYGKDTAGASVVRKSAQFAVPTASAKTSTTTASYASSNSVFGSEICTIIANTVAQRSSLCANAVGYWTASGWVV